MPSSQKKSSWIVGLALFSMFFGSGNLIYPLFVGMISGEETLAGIAGFLLTGVAVPFLGVLGMILFDGNYTKFFSPLGKRLGFLVTSLLLIVWIPLGSSPRCVAVAYASLIPYLSLPSIWVFSLAYCLVVYFFIRNKRRAIDILGYFLTPALLACLGLLFWKGIAWDGLSWAVGREGVAVFTRSLQEGYNTMDLIAAVFFSASIIGLLRQEDGTAQGKYCWTTLRACLVGMSLLAVIYIGLILLAGQHSELIRSLPKDQLLAHIAYYVMGPYYGFVATLAICLACLTTSIALVLVFYEFLLRASLPWIGHRPERAIGVTLALTFGMSIFGLRGVAFVTEPILRVGYPLLIGLILYQLGRHLLFSVGEKEPAPSTELP